MAIEKGREAQCLLSPSFWRKAPLHCCSRHRQPFKAVALSLPAHRQACTFRKPQAMMDAGMARDGAAAGVRVHLEPRATPAPIQRRSSAEAAEPVRVRVRVEELDRRRNQMERQAQRKAPGGKRSGFVDGDQADDERVPRHPRGKGLAGDDSILLGPFMVRNKADIEHLRHEIGLRPNDFRRREAAHNARMWLERQQDGAGEDRSGGMEEAIAPLLRRQTREEQRCFVGNEQLSCYPTSGTRITQGEWGKVCRYQQRRL